MIAARPRSLHSSQISRMIWRDGLGVKRGGRLVHQQQCGILDQGAADADALALPAGQFVRALVGHMSKAHAVQKAEGFVDVRLRKPAQKAAPEPDIAQAAGQHVFHHGQALDQRVFLKDHAHAAAFAAQRARGQAGQFHIAQIDLARGRFDQPVDAADQGGFTGARRADQGQNLTLRDVQIDRLQGLIAGLVRLHKLLKPQHESLPAPVFVGKGGPEGPPDQGLLAGVADAVGRVDLADHVPEFLIGHLEELAFVRLGELCLQRRAFPVEAEERVADLVLQFGCQVVRSAKAGRREGLRFVDRSRSSA